MGLLKRSGDFTPHPAGMYGAFLTSIEEDDSGQYGTRIKWVFDSDHKRDDGQAYRVNYWTSFSLHEKSNLPKVIKALGFDPEDKFWEEVDSLDDMFNAFGNNRRVSIMFEDAKKADGTPTHKVVGIYKANVMQTAATAGKPKGPKPAPPAAVTGDSDDWEQ